jgi:hypothetical protein
MNKVTSLLCSIFLLFTAANPAMAEGEKLREKLSKGTITLTADIKGCDEDAKKLCPGLEANSQKGFMCMMAYEDNLSEKCKLGIAEAAMAIKMGAAAIDYSVRACEADADKYCLDVQPGEGKIVGCLKKNEKKLTKECISALKDTGLWNIGNK